MGVSARLTPAVSRARRVAGRARRRAGALVPRRPAITVVVPFYNVEDYLAECLDSIVGQTFGDLEVLLVDDGSPDGSRAVAERYAARDRRLRVVTRENGGLGAARNTGVREARGRFLTFVDSDDVLPLDALALLHDSAVASGSDIVVGGVERFDSAKTWFPGWLDDVHDRPRQGIRLEEFLPLLRNLYTWNKLFRRDFYLAQDLWFREGVAYEDQPIVTQLLARARAIDVLPDLVYRYRARDDRSSISQQTASLRDLRARIEAWRISEETFRRELSAQVYDAWLVTLFEAHFQWYLTSPGTVQDEYWSELSAEVRRLAADAPPHVWRQASPARRVMVQLALDDRRADAQEFARRNAFRASDWPAEVVDGGIRLGLPFADDAALAPDLFLLRPEQVALTHAIENVHWSGEGSDLVCSVEGWAYLQKVDLGEYDSTVSLVLRPEGGAGGPERVVTAHRHDLLTTPPPVVDAYCDYRQGGFRAVAPVGAWLAGAAPGSSWSVHLRVAAAGFEVTEPVTRLLRLGAAGSVPARPLDQRRTLVADWRFRRPLNLRVELAGASLAALAVEGRELSGRVADAADPRPSHVEVASGAGSASAPVGPDGAFRLTVPSGERAGAEPHRWSVLGRIGARSTGLVAPLDALDADAGGPLTPVATPSGHLALDEWRLAALADTVEVVDDGLVVTGRLVGARAGEVDQLALGTRGVGVSSDGEPVRLDGGRFTARLDLRRPVYRFGRRPLPVGSHELHAVVEGQVLPLLVTATLSARLPGRVDTAVHRGRLVRGPGGAVRLTLQRPVSTNRLVVNRLREAPISGRLERGLLVRSYFGEKATDNGLAIQAELARRGSDLPVWWAVQDHSVVVPDGGIPVVVNSPDWFRLLGSASYYLDNMYQPEYHQKPRGQVLVQTFHGYPFKLMGHPHWRQQQFAQAKIDSYDARAEQWDYLVSPARYASAPLVRDFAYPGQVLEIGYPRNDVLHAPEAPQIRAATRASLGIHEGQTAVLYAPTFRDYLAENDNSAAFADFFDFQRAVSRLGEDVVILIRGHAFHARTRRRVGDLDGCVDVTDYPEVADLYLAADACVADYSSLRFDFGVTGKPMIFHVPDLQRYVDTRGWIMDYEPTAPGPRVATTDEVVDHLLDLDGVRRDHAADYERFRADYLDLEDGHAARRFVDAVFVPRGDA